MTIILPQCVEFHSTIEGKWIIFFFHFLFYIFRDTFTEQSGYVRMNCVNTK